MTKLKCFKNFQLWKKRPKPTVEKETVTIREKLLSDGSTSSLYLDIRHNGKRSREFLKLYLLDGNSKVIKEKNRQTMEQAEAIRSDRLIEMQKGSYEVLQQFKSNTYFLPYYRKMCEERFRTDSQGNENWVKKTKFLSKVIVFIAFFAIFSRITSILHSKMQIFVLSRMDTSHR